MFSTPTMRSMAAYLMVRFYDFQSDLGWPLYRYRPVNAGHHETPASALAKYLWLTVYALRLFAGPTDYCFYFTCVECYGYRDHAMCNLRRKEKRKPM